MASMPASSNSAPSKPATPHVRPYKDFLTPALHRSFTNASLVVLVVCWVEAILMSNWDLFWSWFSLGMNGIRTGLIFVSCLSVFILRLSNLHIGRSTDRSPSESFWRLGISTRAIGTVVWYYMSAFLFSEVYIFSRAEDYKLGWIDTGRSYERPKLNERAILLRTLFGVLAICQAGLHLYDDCDAVLIPYSTGVTQSSDTVSNGSRRRMTPHIRNQLRVAAVPALLQSLAITVGAEVLGLIIYFAIIRKGAWSMTFRVASTLFDVQKVSEPGGIDGATSLLYQFFCSGTLLVVLWQTINTAFTIFITQEPLKKGQPLTNDSKDPNGSLTNGLKAKKDVPWSIALWELQIISQRFDDRRRTIYSDFEKLGSTTWIDIVNTCLAEISAVSQSIKDAQMSASPKTPPQEQAAPLAPKQRIAQPLRTDQPIFSPTPKPNSKIDAIAGAAGTLAKSIGQSPESSPLTAKARSFISSDTTQSQSSSTSGLSQQTQSYALSFLRTPAGSPFRISFRGHINAIIFGYPYSREANIHHAAQALSQLTVCSLREDNFGQVQKDIPRIMRTFVVTIQDVQTLVRTNSPHWTDVYFNGTRIVPEVEELLVTLKGGLELIVMTFGEYIGALGISREELRVAKALVGRGQEMVKR